MNGRRRWLRQALGVAGYAGGAVAAGGVAVPGTSALALAAPATVSTSQPALARGLNLTHWFEYERTQAVDAAELRHLKSLGFDHVRLPLDPLICGWQVADPGRLPFADDLRAAVDSALNAGLALVLDLHLEPSDKERIEASAQGRAACVQLWSALARLMRELPASQLAFELFNEPQFYGSALSAWAPFQQQMLQAVRAQSSLHTVLLTGPQGSSIEGLQRLKPLQDAAAVYVFHYYAPYLFTHQGAHWMETRWTTAGLHQDVRYPSAQQRGRPLNVSRAHPRAAAELQRYVDEDWRSERIAQDLQVAAQWARRHGARLVCNEFGVLRAAAEPASRYRWIGDVRRALEGQGLGWTLWDYTHIFGITAESSQAGRRGARRLEPAALQALGRS